MEKKGEPKPNPELPIKEMKYSQSVEELGKLIPSLKERMKQCPSEDIIFNLIETIDYYGLIRHFKIKSKSEKNDANSLETFKENFLTDLSTYDSFIVIPTVNAIQIETKSNKGNKFNPPKLYDINGDEFGPENFNGQQIIVFLYDNINDLTSFIMRNKNNNCIIYCIGINMNFFDTKKTLKNNGLLNNKIFNFCFSEIAPKSANTSTNLKISNLPRISVVGTDGIIYEDKCIKNVNFFEVQKDLLNNMGKKDINSEEQAKNEKFFYLENENKRKVVKSMNIYLRNNGLNNVHFYVKSKICIDKKGIKKTRCYPVFYGEAKLSDKNKVDNLIASLNSQQLFHDIQCKVKYSQ